MQKVLIIRFSHLGDILLTEPAVRSVADANPDVSIDFLTKLQYVDAARLTGADRVIGLDTEGDAASIWGLSRELHKHCADEYDLIVDLHGSLRSRWAAFNLKAKDEVRYPKNRRTRKREVKKKKHDNPKHTVDLYLTAIEKVGIKPASRVPTLSIPETAKSDGEKALASKGLVSGEFAVLAIGASHPTKHYPIPQWVELAELIVTGMNLKVLIVEKEDYGYLNLFDNLTSRKLAFTLTGADLGTLGAVVSKAKLAVSNDSGIMHLSAGVGTPTFGLFGPTHPSLGFSPLGEKCRAITVNEHCSPCSLHGSAPCFREERFCFTKMKPRMVYDQISEVLSDT